jgi:hypothetical protein
MFKYILFALYNLQNPFAVKVCGTCKEATDYNHEYSLSLTVYSSVAWIMEVHLAVLKVLSPLQYA